MRTLKAISDSLHALALELDHAAFDDVTDYESRAIAGAASQAHSAGLIVAALLEHRHASALEQCARLCRCGDDFGDHLVDAPHACEAMHVRLENGVEVFDPCPCRGFQLAPPLPRDTRRAPAPLHLVEPLGPDPAAALAPTSTPLALPERSS